MTARIRAFQLSPAPPGAPAWFARLPDWLTAAGQTARPRQWPKNLLVFAAPLAAASLGRDEGLGYAIGTAAAFIAASTAVYFVNDVIDAPRDRQHPVKRERAIAAGRLSAARALMLAALAAIAAVSVGLWIGRYGLAALITGYLALSLLYGLVLKHVPVVELVFVASGFVLRALGGAIATNVPPSAWFLLVCSLGALMVAIAKRFTELSALGDQAVAHRPVMRWYTLGWLRCSQRLAIVAMLVAYLLWASAESNGWMRAWHLASALPLGAALIRFDVLVGRAGNRPVEDLIIRDPSMICCELGWLALFAMGL
ncbi:MAG TPA: decaprenyl-phosphate phosphoribosyltransferase [Streptosporangiaceae bacterium]|jgi:decaprenyl-phosphate phosphoribosyltransferase